MVSLKIQCEHSPDGSSYNWFTIAEWRSGIHNTRQLISLCERYHRIRDILARIPEQSKASGNCVGTVVTARGVDTRAKHSCYAGITGVRLVTDAETIAVWCTREKPVEPLTPDVAVLSNRQIAALAGAQLDSFAADAMADEATGDPIKRLDFGENQTLKELLQEAANEPNDEYVLQPTARKPKRVIRDAPKPAASYVAPAAPKPAKKSKCKDSVHQLTNTHAKDSTNGD